VELPDLPPGWPVGLDTEGSGIHVDGDPGNDRTSGAPPARCSVVSIAFRRPIVAYDQDGEKEYHEGEILKYAWPFDQGPVEGKPGKTIKPSLGGGLEVLTAADVDRILSKFPVPAGDLNPKTGKPTTRPMTREEACPNLGLDHWVRLMRWLRERDHLVLQNAKHDMHTLAAGPRDQLIRQQWRDNKAFRDELPRKAQDQVDPFMWTDRDSGPLFGLRLDETCPPDGIEDTMLIQALLDPLQSTALKTTARRLWGEDAADEEKALADARKRLGTGLTKRYDLVPWPAMSGYAAADADLALRLSEHQHSRIAEGDAPPFTAAQIAKDHALMRVLYRMERRGLRYDAQTSLQVAQELRAEMVRIAAPMPYDPSKIAQVGAFYFGASAEGGMGLTPLKYTEKRHDPCVDEAQIRILIQEGHPWTTEYDEYSHLSSAVSKWYDGWGRRTGADGRLRCSFRQCKMDSDRPGNTSGGAISGRLSVERFQAQAIPHSVQLPELAKSRSVRGLFSAKDGHELYKMDLPQGEVRIATVIVDCRKMWDVIDSGEDLHGVNAMRIFGVTIDDPQFAFLRNVAKRIVFGTLYGAGIETLRTQILEFTGIDYSAKDTADARNAFNSEFPEFQRVSRQIQVKADKGLGGCGYVSLIDGRRRVFGYGEHTHKAFNAVIQGDLAQSGKDWMIQVERELPEIMLMATHDDLLVEVPATAQGRAMAQRAAQIGTEVYERDYSVRGRVMRFPIDIQQWKADE
jgi:hypothetical protein